MWNNDQELFALMKESLYTSVVGDIMDKMKLYHQYLPARIMPLDPAMVVAGRAMPVLEADTYGEGNGNQNPVLAKSFGLMLEALDDLKEHEVYICSGASPAYALIGELMCMRAQYLKAAGAVVNGYSRDTNGILELGFPTFSYGCYSQDQAPRGRVLDYRVPIEIEGVLVNPGDIVFGDRDGVLIVPQAVEREVISRAYEKAMGEKTVAAAIQSGLSAKKSFEKYGIM